MENREFKGVWIPKEIWLNKELSLVEKALLAEIDSFTGDNKSFYKSNETIQEEYKISRPTISKALKKLEAMGFINVYFDGRRRKVTYRADRKIFSGREKNTFGQKEKKFPAERNNNTSINTIKKQVKKQSNKDAIVLPWDSERFANIWKEWKQDRKERNIKNYTHRGELAALHKLHNETNGDEQHAIEAIGQSIANQWRGIFPREKKTRATNPSKEQLTNYLKTGDL